MVVLALRKTERLQAEQWSAGWERSCRWVYCSRDRINGGARAGERRSARRRKSSAPDETRCCSSEKVSKRKRRRRLGTLVLWISLPSGPGRQYRLCTQCIFTGCKIMKPSSGWCLVAMWSQAMGCLDVVALWTWLPVEAVHPMHLHLRA